MPSNKFENNLKIRNIQLMYIFKYVIAEAKKLLKGVKCINSDVLQAKTRVKG